MEPSRLDITMKPELSEVDQESVVSPHSEEIEYALILQRLIDAASQNPEQMRATVYEFARARLKVETSWAARPERLRLAAALETAVQGVERFAARRGEMELLPPPTPAAETRQAGSHSANGRPRSLVTAPHELMSEPEDITGPELVYHRSDIRSFGDGRAPGLASKPFVVCMAILTALVVTAALYNFQFFRTDASARLPSHMEASATVSTTNPAGAEALKQAMLVDAKRAAASLDFPIPADYGIYALSNGALSELHPLSERVPDKRIAMSTPVNEASHTVLQDGRAKFILYRRDLVGNAPERVDVRVVAKVVRVLTFDAKGKPNFSDVSDAWNIRNISEEFRVRPIPGNPEMLLVQPQKADFLLRPGRYVLVLKDIGYDFTIGGTITDTSQCLERTDAANGSFYSECQKL